MASGPIIIANAGNSCARNREYAKQIIQQSKKLGLSCVVFELDEKILPLDLFKEFYILGEEIGAAVTASVKSEAGLELLFKLQVPFIKFDYPERLRTDWMTAAIKIGKNVVVSTNAIDRYVLPRDVVRLLYDPSPPTLWHLNFEGLFPDRFEGYSDGSFGIQESLRALRSGAWWIERKVSLIYNECMETEHGKISISLDDLEHLVRDARP